MLTLPPRGPTRCVGTPLDAQNLAPIWLTNDSTSFCQIRVSPSSKSSYTISSSTIPVHITDMFDGCERDTLCNFSIVNSPTDRSCDSEAALIRSCGGENGRSPAHFACSITASRFRISSRRGTKWQRIGVVFLAGSSCCLRWREVMRQPNPNRIWRAARNRFLTSYLHSDLIHLTTDTICR